MKNLILLFGTPVLLVLVCLSGSCKKPTPEPEKPKIIPTSVTDIDNNTYGVKRFDNKLWMTENLRVTRYDTESSRSGDTIAKADNQSVNIEKPYYRDVRSFKDSPYTNNLTNEIRDALGFLYNWCAATGMSDNSAAIGGKVQGICPNGWRLPTSADWDTLCYTLGGQKLAGKKLKSTTGWYTTSGTNESGLNCYPAGLAAAGPVVAMIGQQTMFWSLKTQPGNNAKDNVLKLYFNQDNAEVISINKIQANSVRCIMDIDASFVQ